MSLQTDSKKDDYEGGGAPLRRHRRANNNRPRTTLEQGPTRVLSRDERTAHGKKNAPETIVYDNPRRRNRSSARFGVNCVVAASWCLVPCPDTFPSPSGISSVTSISSHRLFIRGFTNRLRPTNAQNVKYSGTPVTDKQILRQSKI